MYATITKAPLSLSAPPELGSISIIIDKQMKLDMKNKDFGGYLQALMNQKNVSVSALSGLTGYSKMTITNLLRNIEAFRNSECLIKYVFCICIALRLDYMELQGLANRAGFLVNDRKEWDSYIESQIDECICNENVSVISVNQSLMTEKMEPLLPDYVIRSLYDDFF